MIGLKRESPSGIRTRTSILHAIWDGPISRNLGAAVGVQLCLLISGTLSARLLGPRNRGYLAILVVWPSAVAQLGAVGMSLAATYYLSSREIGGSELIGLLRRPATVQVTILTLVTSAIILGYTFISGAPILLAACISLMLLPATFALDYGFAFLLGTRRHGTVSVMRATGPAMYALGLLVLFAASERSLIAVTVVMAASSLCAGAIVFTRGIRAALPVHVRPSLTETIGAPAARRQILAFGRRGYLGYLSPVDSFRIDQLAVGLLVSPRALGIYVVGAAFTNLARTIATNIGLSSTPEIAAEPNPLARRAAIRHTLLLAGAVLTAVTVALGLLVPLVIPILFGSSYRSSIAIAEILFAAGWLLSMKRIAVDAMRGAGEAQVGTRAEVVNLLVFLVASVPLGLALGGPGVAIALVFASACGSLVLFRSLQVHTIMPRRRQFILRSTEAGRDLY